MTDRMVKQMIDERRKDGELQAAETLLSRLKRAWELIALVAVAGFLILGEAAFQWARHRGWTTYTPDVLTHKIITSVAVASGDTLWVGTLGGALRFDGQIWTTYTTADGLVGNDIRSITMAPDGVLWFSTGEGVSRFDGETWTAYAANKGLHNFVSSVAVASDGVLWFGTREGVSRFDGETWTTYTTADGLASNDIRSIAVTPDSTVWFGTWGGVSWLDEETWTTYTVDDGLASADVLSIAVAPDGALWVGTDEGLSRFDGEVWTTYTRANSVLSDPVTALTVDEQGQVWVGTDNGELQVFDQHVGLPAGTLQLWAQAQSVLRVLGVAALLLLAIVWIVRKPKLHPGSQAVDWRFWLQWTLVSAASFAAMLASFVSFIAEPAYLRELLPVILAYVAGGVALWFTLRRQVPRAGWLIAGWYIGLHGSLIAGLVGQNVIQNIFYYGSAAVYPSLWLQIVVGWMPAGAIVGAVVSTIQQLVLRWHIHQASRWVLLNTLACTFVGIAAGIGTNEAPYSVDYWVIGATSGGLMGAIYGAITGVALLRLTQHPISETPDPGSSTRSPK